MCTEPQEGCTILVRRLSIVAVALVVAWSLATGDALAAGDANRATCSEFAGTESSPGFRSNLPDCRAYELVTPPFKGGQPAELRGASADGNHLLVLDFAGFAGTENLEQNNFGLGAIYEFSRTSSGWSTESLEPPPSLAARRNFLGASADLSRSLWELSIQSKEGEEISGGGESPGEAFTLAVREVAPDGRPRLTAVGPMDSPGQHASAFEQFAFQGGSRDLRHILLRVTVGGQRWPGDGTREGDQSLYEYVGTGNSEPRLVGVRNAGALEGTEHVNEHAELVSECGTILGSTGAGSTYNAVSADGAVVYFTAQHTEGCPGSQPTVDEVYARINGSQTVAISEPSPADCKLCDTSSRGSAVFQGASEDGSKVFFLSEQILLPGAKGENLYEYDFDAEEGKRVVLVAAEVPGVARISEDGSHIYFLSKGVLATAPNANMDKAEEGGYNLYVYSAQTGATSFIANLLTAEEEQKIRSGVETSEEVEDTRKSIKVREARVEEVTAEVNGKNAEIAKKAGECKEERAKGEIALAEECEAQVKGDEGELASKESELKEETKGLAKEEEELSREVARQMEHGIQARTHVTAGDDHRPFETTFNGRYLAFVSARDLTRDDTGTVAQVFEYDSETERLVRVSIGQRGSYLCPSSGKVEEGYNCDGNTSNVGEAATILSPDYIGAFRPTEATSTLSLSEAGAVFFSSHDALTPRSIGERENIYEYREGDVYLISPGDEAAPLQPPEPRLLGTDETGSDVFFFTTDSLVPQHSDTQASWYDARAGGGFPAPVSPAGCVAAACQGPLGATPFLPSAGGSESTAEGNLAPPVSTPVKSRTAAQIKAEKLAKALKACRTKHNKHRRAVCKSQARKRYGASKAKKSANANRRAKS
jgi:hypothetical protein